MQREIDEIYIYNNHEGIVARGGVLSGWNYAQLHKRRCHDGCVYEGITVLGEVVAYFARMDLSGEVNEWSLAESPAGRNQQGTACPLATTGAFEPATTEHPLCAKYTIFKHSTVLKLDTSHGINIRKGYKPKKRLHQYVYHYDFWRLKLTTPICLSHYI